MATQLLVIPSRLNNLSSKLKRDSDIQKQINDIAKKAKTAARSFKSVISKDGSAVLLQKTLLMTSEPETVCISDMQYALNEATDKLASTRDLVISLQTDLHSTIEVCRGRKTDYERELDNILLRISNMWAEIESLEVIATTHEDDATTLEVEAVELKKKAIDVKKAAKKKRKHVETVGIIGGITGLVLAPFTGGASLALGTAAAGINAAVNLPAAADCEKQATRLQNDSERKRQKAEELKTEKSMLLKQCSTLKSNMGPVHLKIEGMTEACNVLQQVTSFLLPSIGAIDVLLHSFQDMDIVFKDVTLQNNSFETIRNIFSNQPERMRRYSPKYLTELKEKWEQLEETLLQHGAQNAIN